MTEEPMQPEQAYNVPMQYIQQQQPNKQVMLPSQSLEFLQFVLNPDTKESYEHINKDLATSNANSEEINYVQLNLQLLHLISYIEVKRTEYGIHQQTQRIVITKEGDMAKLKHIILQDIYAYLQLLRSKNGFERLAETTQINKQEATYKEELPSKRKWF